MPRLTTVLRALGPVIAWPRPAEVIAGAAGAGVALSICAAVILWSGASPTGGLLIAPMGATAVILFALPNSPLAQPWSAVVGNTASAAMATAVHQVADYPAVVIGAAALLSLAAMFVLRALHPPGGAVALTAALNPAMLDAGGLRFVLGPALIDTAALVVIAILWHRLNGRVYPFRHPQAEVPHAPAVTRCAARSGSGPRWQRSGATGPPVFCAHPR